NVSSNLRSTSAGTGAEPHIANRSESHFGFWILDFGFPGLGIWDSGLFKSIESIVATEPNDVIRYFSMMSQKREAENFGDTTVDPPAYSAVIVVTDTAF